MTRKKSSAHPTPAPAVPPPETPADLAHREWWEATAAAIELRNWVSEATRGDLADAIAQADQEYQRWQVILSNHCAQCREGDPYRTWPSDVVRAEVDLVKAYAFLACLTRYRSELGTRPPLAPLHLPARGVVLRGTIVRAYGHEDASQRPTFFSRLARKFGEAQVIATPESVSRDVSVVLRYCADIVAVAAEIDAAFEDVARQAFPGQAALTPNFLPVARCLYDIAASWSGQPQPPGEAERSIRGLTRYGEQVQHAIRRSSVANPPKEIGTLKAAALAFLRANLDTWFTPNMLDEKLKRRPGRSGRMRAVLKGLLADGLVERQDVPGTRGHEYRAAR